MKAQDIIKLVDEEYYTRMKLLKKGSASIEVFVNPTNKETQRDLPQLVKFVVDLKSKEVFVWDVNGPLHVNFWQEDKHRNLHQDTKNQKTILGYAKKVGGKLVWFDFDGGQFMQELFLQLSKTPDKLNTFLGSLDWVNRYIDIKDPIDKLKQYF